MSYVLVIGDRAYSSWSMRGWLLFDAFGIPCELRHATLGGDGDGWAEVEALPPSATVPTMSAPDGAIAWDSLAIAEELASREPEAGIWPRAPAARARARSLAAEMHSGFAALRRECPMNLHHAWSGCAPSGEVLRDVARIEAIWGHALDASGGPWLCGGYSAADAFFAPVAARFAGYGIALGDASRAYVDRHLADPAFRRWRAMALADGTVLERYGQDLAPRAWPGPRPEPAAPADGPGVNGACPYSGRPPTHFLEAGGSVYGFCNAFCRDKTVADPGAWPAFAAIRA